MHLKVVFVAAFVSLAQTIFSQTIGLGRGNYFPGNNIGLNNNVVIGNGLQNTGIGINNNQINNIGASVSPNNGQTISTNIGTNVGTGISSTFVPDSTGLPISNLNIGYGDVSVIGDLPIAGSTTVLGNVPVIGYVTFEGNVPAGGTVSVTGTCGCSQAS